MMTTTTPNPVNGLLVIRRDPDGLLTGVHCDDELRKRLASIGVGEVRVLVIADDNELIPPKFLGLGVSSCHVLSAAEKTALRTAFAVPLAVPSDQLVNTIAALPKAEQNDRLKGIVGLPLEVPSASAAASSTSTKPSIAIRD